jgi:hypothetical protein
LQNVKTIVNQSRPPLEIWTYNATAFHFLEQRYRHLCFQTVSKGVRLRVEVRIGVRGQGQGKGEGEVKVEGEGEGEG